MGEQGSAGLDVAVFHAVLFAMWPERVRDGLYRLHPSNDERRQQFADWLQEAKPEGVTLGAEMPPHPPHLRIEVQPERESPRRMWLHTGEADAPRLIARAIDAGLSVREVETVGLFLMTGPSQRQVHWVMYSQRATREQALQIMGATEEQLRAEDTGPPPITVALPDRETLSSITRDSSGNILSVVQTSRDLPAAAAGEVAE